MLNKIILERNYPVWIKLSIDFFLLAITFFFISELIEMPVYYLASISHLVYAFVIIVLFYIFDINLIKIEYKKI